MKLRRWKPHRLFYLWYVVNTYPGFEKKGQLMSYVCKVHLQPLLTEASCCLHV